MMELPAAATAASSFPVVFFDGEREVDIGTVAVHPALSFKKFQAVISQKIGIAPHQISFSLVRRKKARASPEVRRKVPIDESSDFAAIARERDCFVLAVLRRSRRERRGRSRRGQRQDAAAGEAVAGQRKAVTTSTVPEKTILRRNPAGSGAGVDPAIAALMPETVGLGLWDYESQLRDLQRQRERYLLSTAAYYPYAAAEGAFAWDAAARRAAAPERPAVCEECERAKEEGRPPGFHWCVCDAVTVGFRSPVGPIQRPPKKHVEASA
ncbi:hypothetical protein COCNU_01G017740 [Cocos nucifera]|uniref:DUF7138 domain-containing protein n=1 Tax=Cocos nucifera TaxID=13894 RepID=A0A8K0HWG7_COCNU|nr:hypothetical protein COCNU_01G017740 [Cocos nucifera]